MNFLKPLLPFLFCTSILLAQDTKECKNIVDITVESINKHSSEPLNPFLAENFTIAGQKGPIAKMVLAQLFSQLNETVITYDELDQTITDQGLELVYTIEYKTMGPKEAKFVFNESNQLTDLSLFDMEVKTMSGDTDVLKSSSNVVDVPFTMLGKLIAVNVILNGKNRLFLLDSGAPKVILNSKYLPKKETALKTMSSTKGVSGDISGMDVSTVEELDFAGIRLVNQEVITLDLSHLEDNLGSNIYGLIGYELIKDYDILFDYDNLQLTLIDPNTFENYKNETLSNFNLETIPFTLKSHIPVIKAQVDETLLSYGIDCGAESNLISEIYFEKLKNHIQSIQTDQLLGADNQPKSVHKGNVNGTKIGTKSFENLPTVFSDISHLNEGYKLNIDGLIGYEILRKQKTLLSYARKELIFIVP